MNLYLISQTENRDWDTYDSAVVAAPNENAARVMHPNGSKESRLDEAKQNKYIIGTWVNNPKYVTVQFIGVAAEGTQRSVVCSSFNAG